jgi:hypothetical protein
VARSSAVAWKDGDIVYIGGGLGKDSHKLVDVEMLSVSASNT